MQVSGTAVTEDVPEGEVLGVGLCEGDEERAADPDAVGLGLGAGALSTFPAAKQGAPATAVWVGLGVGVAAGSCDALVAGADSASAAVQPETDITKAVAIRNVAKRTRLAFPAR